MCELSACLHRYEDYVDQCYKEFLKSQGKVDSVRLAEAAGGEHREAQRLSLFFPRVTVFLTGP